VRSLDTNQVLFVPDENLGRYISGVIKEKEIILWKGYCITHHRVNAEEVLRAKELHHDALVLVHPECRAEILELADFIGSTKQIIDYAAKSEHKKFLIGTEMGILHNLKKNNPEKEFFLLSKGLICPNMKKTSLLSVYNSLKDMKYEIQLEKDISTRAKIALDRMLAVD
jgi:quinolinate synthase